MIIYKIYETLIAVNAVNIVAAISRTAKLRAQNFAPSCCPTEAPEEGTTCPKKQKGKLCAWDYLLMPIPSGRDCVGPLRCVPTRRCLCDTNVEMGKGASTTSWTCPNLVPIFCEKQPTLSFQPCTTECPHEKQEAGEACTFWPTEENGVNCRYDYFKFYNTESGECKKPFVCNPTTMCTCDYSTGSGIWDCVPLLHGGYCDETTFNRVQTEHKCEFEETKKSKKKNNCD